MRGMRRMRAPAIMQAMPSSRLLMLTVISFPPGLRLMRLMRLAFDTILPQWVLARLLRRRLSRLEWNWRDAGFFLRADGGFSPEGFDRLVLLPFARGNWIPWSGIISD